MRRFVGPAASFMMMAGLACCGGGGSDTSNSEAPLVLSDAQVTTAAGITLSAHIISGGTYLHCTSSQTVNVTLTRAAGDNISSQTVTCPFDKVVQGDFAAASYEISSPTSNGGTATVTSADVTLPDPAVVVTPTSTVVKSPLPSSASTSMQLQALSDSGAVLADFADPSQVPAAYTSTAHVAQWRWTAQAGGHNYFSDAKPALAFNEQNLGYWGALPVGDLGDGQDVLLGVSAPPTGDGPTRYSALGLGILFQNRDFRDVRIADLNNDGLNDVVSNVYGNGCLIVGLRRAGGGYTFSTPLSDAGTCISGNGETLLVADFDGDGLLDIFVPTYQRFYLLRNEGDGQFKDISAQAGVTYPNYAPTAEGGAAVDIDLNGTVDIVIGSEVLLNDGTGKFTPLNQPFHASRFFDEGMSVADLDNDGLYDIVKNDPSLGPLVFWGRSDRHSFDVGGWLLGGGRALDSSYGIAVEDFSGSGLPDVLVAGGMPVGTPPVMCAQTTARRFQCMTDMFPAHSGAWSDLLLATDLNGDGAPDLVARYGPLRIYTNQGKRNNVFKIDLRDAAGRRTMYGHTLQARCTVDRSLLGTKFVDGGNGYMAQGDYLVNFTSSWCPSILVDLPTSGGMHEYGPFNPGTSLVTAG